MSDDEPVGTGRHQHGEPCLTLRRFLKTLPADLLQLRRGISERLASYHPLPRSRVPRLSISSSVNHRPVSGLVPFWAVAGSAASFARSLNTRHYAIESIVSSFKPL